jgi:CBS domain-containing protein
MKVREVMTPAVITVSPDTSFKETAMRLLDYGVSAMPVVDDDGDLVGLVTEADLMSKEAFGGKRRRPLAVVVDALTGGSRYAPKASGLTAADVMTRHLVTAAPGEDIAAAARRMLAANVKRLPVLDEGRLVGIVSRHDLLRLFHRPDTDIAAEIETKLASPLYAPEEHGVIVKVADGVVTLHGRVRDRADAQLVEGLAWRVRGVVAVVADVTPDETD